jgi:hypothetical protein
MKRSHLASSCGVFVSVLLFCGMEWVLLPVKTFVVVELALIVNNALTWVIVLCAADALAYAALILFAWRAGTAMAKSIDAEVSGTLVVHLSVIVMAMLVIGATLWLVPQVVSYAIITIGLAIALAYWCRFRRQRRIIRAAALG